MRSVDGRSVDKGEVVGSSVHFRSDRSKVGDDSLTSNARDDSSISLTSSNLSNGVGLSISLAVVDAVNRDVGSSMVHRNSVRIGETDRGFVGDDRMASNVSDDSSISLARSNLS